MSDEEKTMTDYASRDSFHGMKIFKCHKLVAAGKILSIEKSGNGWTLELDGAQGMVLVQVQARWFARHNPEVDGYFVEYADGFQSYSPEEPFETGYNQYFPPAKTIGGAGS